MNLGCDKFQISIPRCNLKSINLHWPGTLSLKSESDSLTLTPYPFRKPTTNTFRPVFTSIPAKKKKKLEISQFPLNRTEVPRLSLH